MFCEINEYYVLLNMVYSSKSLFSSNKTEILSKSSKDISSCVQPEATLTMYMQLSL